jgi:hypothetical protein
LFSDPAPANVSVQLMNSCRMFVILSESMRPVDADNGHCPRRGSQSSMKGSHLPFEKFRAFSALGKIQSVSFGNSLSR